ncbi:hypothetical protein DSO57_1009902 [Entomophthora muscae]|uniref:Uncharacterized protein n=1 Tax=Entomophthora muscae TaxID=34485 RepID=A0ACC2U5T4_9FUNG|nr:hypothetical protein DSO57_1009902 [Entomophthora muscae]
MLHMDFGSSSHIRPLLEIGKVLQGRNHTIVYAASDANKKYMQGYSFQFISLGKSVHSLERKTSKEFYRDKEAH